MSDLKLEVGQVWLCSDGVSKARIVNREGWPDYPWVAVVDGITRSYSESGEHVLRKCSQFDLVKLLTPAPIDLTEQTIETFAALTRNGGKVPDGMKRQCRSKVIDEPFVDVMALDIFHTCLHYRLVPIEPPKPEMVPLEASDVPPGSYFKRAGDSWLAPSDVCRTGVHFYGLDMPFEKLMEEGWQILRPGQTEWQKCEKVKP